MSDPETKAPAPLALVGTTTAPLDLRSVGEILVKSKFFADVRDAAQAMVKVMAGRELGLPPMAAMMGIHIIQGKPALSATAMASVIQRSGQYRYRVRELSDKVCKLEFFERIGDAYVSDNSRRWEWESVGVSEFTHEDAIKAGMLGKGTFRQFPRNMLFARALSNGWRWFCPGLAGGPVYTPEELGVTISDEGDVFNAEPPRPQEGGAGGRDAQATVIEVNPALASPERDATPVTNAEFDSAVEALDQLGDWRTKKSITRAIFGEWVESVEHLALLAEQSPAVWREGLARLGLVDG